MMTKAKKIRRKIIAVTLVISMLLLPVGDNGILGMGGLTASISQTAKAAETVVTDTYPSYPFFHGEPTTADPSLAYGSKENPIEITTAQELYNMQYVVSAGTANDNYVITDTDTNEETSVLYAACYYKLMNAVDISSVANWEPIGYLPDYPFMGHFDGNNQAITGMNYTLQENGSPCVGLFGCIKGAEIKNVVLAGASLTGTTSYIHTYGESLLVAKAESNTETDAENDTSTTTASVIKDCRIDSDCEIDVKSTAFKVDTTNNDLYAANLAMINDDMSTGVGAIVGIADSLTSIRGCMNNAPVQAEGYGQVGGIVGRYATPDGEFSNYESTTIQYANEDADETSGLRECRNNAAIKGNRYVGGVVGFSSEVSIVSACNYGDVYGMEWGSASWQNIINDVNNNGGAQWNFDDHMQPGQYVGGIVGKMGYHSDAVGVPLSVCANAGKVSGTKYCAGIAGQSYNSVEKCLNSGEVSAIDTSGYQNAGSDYTTEDGGGVTLTPNGNTESAYTVTPAVSDFSGVVGAYYIQTTPYVISYCANIGSVSAPRSVGGILGTSASTENTGEIYVSQSYNVGTVEATQDDSLTLAQKAISTLPIQKNCYYLDDESSDPAEGATMDTHGRILAEFTSGYVCNQMDTIDGALSRVWQQRLTGDVIDTYPVFHNPMVDDSLESDKDYSVIRITYTNYDDADTTDYSDRVDYVNSSTPIASLFEEEDGIYYEFYIYDDEGQIIDEPVLSIATNQLVAVKKAVATPSPTPTLEPTATPTVEPTTTPTIQPTATPTVEPTATPTIQPAATPTTEPTATPTKTPIDPIVIQTEIPIPAQTIVPTPVPVVDSTASPAPTLLSSGSNVTVGTITYEVKSTNEIAVDGVTQKNKTTVLKIPATTTINGVTYRVTEIAANAFNSDKKLTKVVMGGNIQRIGNAAFKNCKKIKTVSFSKKIQKIGNDSFNGCTKVKSIALPDSIRTIGSRAFKNCKSVKKMVIGKKASAKGALLSNGADLVSSNNIFIPFSTQNVEKQSTLNQNALNQNLQSIIETIKTYQALNLSIKVGNNAMENCTNLGSVIVNAAVSVIGNSAFKNCTKLSSIIVRSLILKQVGKKALLGVSKCKISVPDKKLKPYKKLFKNKGQGKKVMIAKA